MKDMRNSQERSSWRLTVVRFVSAILLLPAAGMYMKYRLENIEHYETTVIPPGCEEGGYTLYTNTQTGSTEIRNTVPAVGHKLGRAQELRAGSELEPELLSRTCKVCGEQQVEAVYPELPITRLSLKGSNEGIAKKMKCL